MESEAKARHPRMLLQSVALSVKCMKGEAVQVPSMNLNGLSTPGEKTFTPQGRTPGNRDKFWETA